LPVSNNTVGRTTVADRPPEVFILPSWGQPCSNASTFCGELLA
jgi:hypothetical protein